MLLGGVWGLWETLGSFTDHIGFCEEVPKLHEAHLSNLCAHTNIESALYILTCAPPS